MSKKPEYVHLPVNCDLSLSGLAEAVKIVGQSKTYYLSVHVDELDYANGELIPQIGAFDLGLPFRPEIVLQNDNTLDKGEWFIAANGLRAGSPGP
jgi:hypothetical protein